MHRSSLRLSSPVGHCVSAPVSPQSDVSPDTNLVTLPEETAAAYHRPDGSVHCVPRTLSPPEYRNLDLPRINYAYNGRKYRYTYTCHFVRAVGNSERVSVTEILGWRTEGARLEGEKLGDRITLRSWDWNG